jgi:hypothetical protein
MIKKKTIKMVQTSKQNQQNQIEDIFIPTTHIFTTFYIKIFIGEKNFSFKMPCLLPKDENKTS